MPLIANHLCCCGTQHSKRVNTSVYVLFLTAVIFLKFCLCVLCLLLIEDTLVPFSHFLFPFSLRKQVLASFSLSLFSIRRRSWLLKPFSIREKVRYLFPFFQEKGVSSSFPFHISSMQYEVGLNSTELRYTNVLFQ